MRGRRMLFLGELPNPLLTTSCTNYAEKNVKLRFTFQ